MIELEFRSYTSGKIFRPKPLVFSREDAHLQAVITPWGPTEVAEQIWGKIYESLETPETGPANPYNIPGETKICNRLAHALRVVNEDLFQNENQKQLRMGFEVLLLFFQGQKLAWARVGQPHMVLFNSKEVHPLAYQPDWGWHCGNAAPLLSSAVGVESRMAIQMGFVDWRKGSELCLVSRSYLPTQFFASTNRSLQGLSSTLVNDSADAPFWIAVGR